MAGIQVRGVNDVQKILMVYEDFHKVSGLQVNLKKTEMLCINTDARLKDRYKMCGRSQKPGNRGKKDLQEYGGSNKQQ